MSERSEQFKALIDAGEHFNADVTHVAGRDREGNLLFVCCYAKGETAAALERWLNRQSRKGEKRESKPSRPGRANGGKARARSLSPERRSEIARDAAEARWNGNGDGS